MKKIPVELEPNALHAAQRKIHESRSRFKIAACGRRFGKSHLGILTAREAARKKKRALVWWLSPEGKQAARKARQARRLIIQAGDASADEQNADRLQFKNGSVLEFLTSGSWDHLRGEGLDFLVVDEAEDVPEYVWTNILRPALIDNKGAALVLGTPKRCGSWFHRLHQQGQTTAGEFKSWTFSSYENPRLDRKELDALRAEMTERDFKQEILAQWADRAGQVFSRFAACIGAQLLQRGISGSRYFHGVDLGRAQDFTVACTLHYPHSTKGRAELHGFSRWKGKSWEETEARLISQVERFPGEVLVDATGLGDPIAERLEAAGLEIQRFVFTSQSKTNLIAGLQLAFERQDLLIPEIPELIEELESFECVESTTTQQGSYEKFSPPPGKHDDCVIALALAWQNLWNHAPLRRPTANRFFGFA